MTGPTGAVGMALLEYLTKKGVQTIAVVRSDSGRKAQICESENLIIVECALEEYRELPERVLASMKKQGWDTDLKPDVFYHFAWDGTSGNGRNDMYLQNRNVTYALQAVDAAAKLGCGLFIGAGSQAEYGRYEGKLDASVPVCPENGYGIAKLCAGQMTRLLCGQKGMRHIWTRILSVYGPYDGSQTMVMNAIAKMLRGERVSCTRGEQIWDYLYSKDAAKMMYLLGESGVSGKTYCLGSGVGKPLKEYIEMIKEAAAPEAEIGYGDIPYSDGQVMYLCADLKELTEDTGYKADYSFEEGIRETVEWYKKSRSKTVNEWTVNR